MCKSDKNRHTSTRIITQAFLFNALFAHSFFADHLGQTLVVHFNTLACFDFLTYFLYLHIVLTYVYPFPCVILTPYVYVHRYQSNNT